MSMNWQVAVVVRGVQGAYSRKQDALHLAPHIRDCPHQQRVPRQASYMDVESGIGRNEFLKTGPAVRPTAPTRKLVQFGKIVVWDTPTGSQFRASALDGQTIFVNVIEIVDG